MNSYDVIVIGGGIAGVAAAYELGKTRSVAILEMESTLAFHTTGRSAATFLETYGGPEIRALTTGSRAFLENPSETFDRSPLSPLGLVWVATEGDEAKVDRMYAEMRGLVPSVQIVSPEQATEINPILNVDYVSAALYEPEAREIDVHALHQGYARGFKGIGVVHAAARVVAAHRENGMWTLADSGGQRYRAPLVVNAAGAWVDVVAAIHGARGIGIRPLRRTIFMVPSPGGSRTAGLPMAADVNDEFYVKPDGEQYLCSPADEVLQQPSDPRPDELEIARAIDVINDATGLDVRHVRSTWAGLRNFAPDRVPVIGYDREVEGFFWFAGQGGYGIQTAPAAASLVASLIDGEGVPADLEARGLRSDSVSPERFSVQVSSAGTRR
ncbi:NAD(P)/FAD-dependent oxidoreductase [Antricoccus suffuscus]|nr:FAD-binding oxidoreductase [Antricoccus suffuscus]